MTGRTLAPARAVSFDFGQTLVELDTGMLVARLGERGASADRERLEARIPAMWRAYDRAIDAGAGGHPWKVLMRTLLEAVEVSPARREALVDWLWDEQPRRNLWRRPIAGMLDVARNLRAAGVPIAVVSNSEGRLAELIDELGWSELLPIVADSGRLGIEKPAPGIFTWAADALAVPVESIVHIGDSRAADVDGALAAGMRAIWFGPHVDGDGPGSHADDGLRLRCCRDAAEVRDALRDWLLLPAVHAKSS